MQDYGLAHIFFYLERRQMEEVKSTMSRHIGLILAGLAMLAAMGCGKPPVEKIQAADRAMQAAQSAEAREYAADALLSAEEVMERAQAAKAKQDSKFALFRSYGDVGIMYDSASALASEAEAKAKAEKERIRAEVAAELTRIDSMITATGQALAEAPRGKGTKADLELMKASLDAIVSAFAAAKADFDAGRYRPVQAKLAAIANDITNLTAEIEAAKQKVGKR